MDSGKELRRHNSPCCHVFCLSAQRMAEDWQNLAMPPQVRDRIIDAFTEFANDFIEIHILHPVFLTTAPPQHKIQLASRLVPRALLFPSRTPRASKMPVQ